MSCLNKVYPAPAAIPLPLCPRSSSLPSLSLLSSLPLPAKNGTVAEAQLGQLRRRYLAAMRSKIPGERRNATWLVDKALSNAWLVGHIALLMPRACVVHAVRHPADTALSSFQQSSFPDKVSLQSADFLPAGISANCQPCHVCLPLSQPSAAAAAVSLHAQFPSHLPPAGPLELQPHP